MSLVVLTTSQFQDGGAAVPASDAAFFKTHFSEPLTVFPGQTVELVSFSYEKAPIPGADEIPQQIQFPSLLISVPELGTRGYNGRRQNVDNVVGLVPAKATSTPINEEPLNQAPRFNGQIELDLENVNRDVDTVNQIPANAWPALDDELDVLTNHQGSTFQYEDGDLVRIGDLEFEVTAATLGGANNDLTLRLKNLQDAAVPAAPIGSGTLIEAADPLFPADDMPGQFIRVFNNTPTTQQVTPAGAQPETITDTSIRPKLMMVDQDGVLKGSYTLGNFESTIFKKRTTDRLGYFYNRNQGGISVKAVVMDFDNFFHPNAASTTETYIPPIPQQLLVNVPGKVELNSLTCKISLLSGALASKEGGNDNLQGNYPLMKKCTVTLRLSAPPDNLAA